MEKRIGLLALALVAGVTAQSYAFDPYYDQDQQRYIERQRYLDQQGLRDPTVGLVANPVAIEGDVIRIDPDSYVVRDLSGRDVRVYFDRATVRENINVGDHVIVRFDRAGAPYATSIVRRPLEPGLVPATVLPRPQTVEGEVLRINTDSYVIRDMSGREIRLHVDKTTKLDGNLTPGDRVVARLSTPTGPAPYARSIYKLNSGQVVEGQVVAVNGDTYIVRDANGNEERIVADPATIRDANIMVGDRVLVVRGETAMAHAESINKR